MGGNGFLVGHNRRILARANEIFDNSSPVKFVGIGSTTLCWLCELEDIRYCGPPVLCLTVPLLFRCILLLEFLLLFTKHPASNALERVLACERWRLYGRWRFRHRRFRESVLCVDTALRTTCCVLVDVFVDEDIGVLTRHLA